MAQNDYQERLERVRTEALGIETLQEFIDRLNEGRRRLGEVEDVPYATARRYHRDGRDPPFSYLKDITRVFGIRWDFLATGEEPLTEKEVRAQQLRESLSAVSEKLASQQATQEAIAKALELRRSFLDDSPGTRGMVRELLADVLGGEGRDLPDPPLSESEALLLVDSILRIVAETFWLFRDESGSRDSREFTISMLQTLIGALPRDGSGSARGLAARLVLMAQRLASRESFTPENIPEYLGVPRGERARIATWIEQERISGTSAEEEADG